MRRLPAPPLSRNPSSGTTDGSPVAASISASMVRSCSRRHSRVIADTAMVRGLFDFEVVSLRGDSYRLRNRDPGRVPHRRRRVTAPQGEGANIHPSPWGQHSAAVDTSLAVSSSCALVR